MSHAPQRKEKDCLNCGTIVQGHYCQNCGQGNVVPRETFWHMVTHFFYDITHFDSKFFETIKDLVFKPGFLPGEYMKGRRATYLHPIKMYVFTSAVFFLFFFSLFKPTAKLVESEKPLTPEEKVNYIDSLQALLKKDTGNIELKEKLTKVLDTSQKTKTKNAFLVEDRDYETKSEYDSAQKALPKEDRDGWVMRRLVYKTIDLNTKYGADPDEALVKLGEGILHRLPYMLFVSLPLFALILRLVYIRRKQFYFADHGVFTIHLYVFSFLLLLTNFGLDKLNKLLHWTAISILMGLLVASLFFYLYKAMRNFYGQRRAKTFLKFLLVSVLSLIMMLVLFVLFTFFSAISL